MTLQPQQLFSRSRRDFSHGCIRVENPVALAAWVLRDKPEWDKEHILSAMNGDKTFRVNLIKPIPVLILYGTATVTKAEKSISSTISMTWTQSCSRDSRRDIRTHRTKEIQVRRTND